ncbi:MAG TPA: zinc finger MYND domain-containing protein [Chlamydiales bacterium]|nr:zinc finger MYND domain-containing protein [Chlamydiales bacterium]
MAAPISSSSSSSTPIPAKVCAVCQTTETLKKCDACKWISYCGPDHQRQDWPSHKKICQSVCRKQYEEYKKSSNQTHVDAAQETSRKIEQTIDAIIPSTIDALSQILILQPLMEAAMKRGDDEEVIRTGLKLATLSEQILQEEEKQLELHRERKRHLKSIERNVAEFKELPSAQRSSSAEAAFISCTKQTIAMRKGILKELYHNLTVAYENKLANLAIQYPHSKFNEKIALLETAIMYAKKSEQSADKIAALTNLLERKKRSAPR